MTSNLNTLQNLNLKNILDVLRKRYNNNNIYTYSGHTLISINPYKKVYLYNDNVINAYRNSNRHNHKNGIQNNNGINHKNGIDTVDKNKITKDKSKITKDSLQLLENQKNQNVIENQKILDSNLKDVNFKNLTENSNTCININSDGLLYEENAYYPIDEPHIYSLALQSLNLLDLYPSVTIIISGDSGSGKTFNFNQLINFICDDTIKKQIIAINTILEAFGNARTELNLNSSRFGKMITLNMQNSKVIGARVETFLLEKNRVTSKKENNFHIFYYMLRYMNLDVDNEYIKYNKETEKQRYNDIKYKSNMENTKDGNVNLNSKNGNINTDNFTEDGNVNINSKNGNINTDNFTEDGNVNINSKNGNIKNNFTKDFNNNYNNDNDNIRNNFTIDNNGDNNNFTNDNIKNNFTKDHNNNNNNDNIKNNFTIDSNGDNNNLTNDYNNFVDFKSCYLEVLNGLELLGIKNISEIQNILLSIVELGNITFTFNNNSYQITNHTMICELLEIKKEDLEDWLLFTFIKLPKEEIIKKPNDLSLCIKRRDTLARNLYSNLFDYLCTQINNTIQNKTITTSKINLLDIYGFECFNENNGFEQFNINWANERLQNEYVKRMVDDIKKMFVSEGIEKPKMENLQNLKDKNSNEKEKNFNNFKDISTADKKSELNNEEYYNKKTNTIKVTDTNKDTNTTKNTIKDINPIKDTNTYTNIKNIDNLWRRTALFDIEGKCQLYDLINESSLFKTNDLLQKISNHCPNIKINTDKFCINHYASDVWYSITNFVESNNETTINFTNFNSSNTIIKNFRSVDVNTVLKSFRISLDLLFESIERSKVFFVRCIKPNTSRRNYFDMDYVHKQLLVSGVCEMVEISRKYESHYMDIDEFKERYEGLEYRIIEYKDGNIINNTNEIRSDYEMQEKINEGKINEGKLNEGKLDEGKNGKKITFDNKSISDIKKINDKTNIDIKNNHFNDICVVRKGKTRVFMSNDCAVELERMRKIHTEKCNNEIKKFLKIIYNQKCDTEISKFVEIIYNDKCDEEIYKFMKIINDDRKEQENFINDTDANINLNEDNENITELNENIFMNSEILVKDSHENSSIDKIENSLIDKIKNSSADATENSLINATENHFNVNLESHPFENENTDIFENLNSNSLCDKNILSLESNIINSNKKKDCAFYLNDQLKRKYAFDKKEINHIGAKNTERGIYNKELKLDQNMINNNEMSVTERIKLFNIKRGYKKINELNDENNFKTENNSKNENINNFKSENNLKSDENNFRSDKNNFKSENNFRSDENNLKNENIDFFNSNNLNNINCNNLNNVNSNNLNNFKCDDIYNKIYKSEDENDNFENQINFVNECGNCKILEIKYKHQTYELKNKLNLEAELQAYKKRIHELEEELKKHTKVETKTEPIQSNIETFGIPLISPYDVFGCLLELYIDVCPEPDTFLPQKEITSLAHVIYQVFIILNAKGYNLLDQTKMFVSQLKERYILFEKDLHKVCFILTNIVELKFIINGDELLGNGFLFDINCLLDEIIHILYIHLCETSKEFLLTCIPECVLEFQGLREFYCKQKFYDRFFGKKKDIGILISKIQDIDHIISYNYLHPTYKYELLRYLFSTINTVCFNCLLIKPKFLSFNRNLQINNNLNMIEKLCVEIDFNGMDFLIHLREVVKLVNLVRAGVLEEKILDSIKLSRSHIGALLNVIDDDIKFSVKDENGNKFLCDAKLKICVLDENVEFRFLVGRYVPSKYLQKILESI